MLKIKNITKKFNGKTILNNISLEIEKGSICVFLGKSGVGKSTFLRVLNNLESLDGGEIYFDDNGVNSKAIVNNTEQIAENSFGMVFQQYNIFKHLTVKQNITLALEKVKKIDSTQAQKIANELLAKYGLTEVGDYLPYRLSGGQKQRLAIARTIALKPKIICMDEPTSALDPKLTNYIAQTVNELSNEGFTILISTHDMSLINKLNCTVHLMDNGTIIQSAKSDQLTETIKSFING